MMVDCVKPALISLVMLALTGVLRAEEGQQVSEDYKQAVLKWRVDHAARFRSPTGWLALTGHYWLKPGENLLGVDEDLPVRLPADAALGICGIFRVDGNKVTLTVLSGGPLLVDGQPMKQAELPIDGSAAESDCAVKLEIGERLKLQLVRRAGRYVVRVRDSASELIKEFPGMQWFDVDERFRISAQYRPFPQPKTVKIVNIKGDEIDSPIAGSVEFQFMGQAYRLDAIQEPGSLFVIFKDQTSGKSTYGAGRFVDVELPAGSDGQVVIDFNKSYSPPCAWSPHTLCPLPPKQNHLPIAINAGEKSAVK